MILSPSDTLLLWKGLQITLWLTLWSTLFTFLVGISVALYRFLMPAPFRWFGNLYVDMIRSMPLVLYLVLIFVVFPVPPFQRAVFALATFNGAFIAEIIRTAVTSLDNNQLKAATLLGIKEWQTFLFIALPQALARMVPAFINQLNTLLKDTSLVSLGMLELAKGGEILMERAFDDAFKIILIMATIYFTLCLALSIVGQITEKWLRPWKSQSRPI